MLIKIKEYLEEHGFTQADFPDSFDISCKKFCLTDVEDIVWLNHPYEGTFMLSSHPFHYAEIVSLLEDCPDLTLHVINRPNFKGICNPAYGIFACSRQ